MFDLPEGLGSFVIKEFNKSTVLKGHKLGEAFIGSLIRKNSEPIQIILPLRFPDYDSTRKGKETISIEAFSARYSIGLQVTKDPGVWLVYCGFILMIVGCFITFFMSHQRICVEVLKSGQHSSVIVTGITNKDKPGMQNKIDKISKRLMNCGYKA